MDERRVFARRVADVKCAAVPTFDGCRSAPPRLVQELGDQPGLSDACLAADDYHEPSTPPGAAQLFVEELQNALATNERGLDRAGDSPKPMPFDSLVFRSCAS